VWEDKSELDFEAVRVAIKRGGKKVECSGSHRSGSLTAGGALSIAAGVFELIDGVSMAVMGDLGVWFLWWPLQSGLNVWGESIGDLAQPPPPAPIWPLIMIGLVLVALGVFAILGGISAIRRKDFGRILSWGYLRLAISYFGDTGSYFCRSEKERI
jgi:hypothetical protein